MDEKTVRIALQVPEDMIRVLDRVSKREGFETRKIGRAIRWCIREEAKRQYDLDEEEHWREMQAEMAAAGDPPPDPNPKSAAELFPEWTDEKETP